MRITDAKLRLLEVPVHMRQREHGESSFSGRRAVELVVTIGLTLFAGELLRRRHQRTSRSRASRGLLPRRLSANEPSPSAATPAPPARGRSGAAPPAATAAGSAPRRRSRRAAGARRGRRTPPSRARGPARRADHGARARQRRALWLRGRVGERDQRARPAPNARPRRGRRRSASPPPPRCAPAPRPSGAATAAASSACATGSVAATR